MPYLTKKAMRLLETHPHCKGRPKACFTCPYPDCVGECLPITREEVAHMAAGNKKTAGQGSLGCKRIKNMYKLGVV